MVRQDDYDRLIRFYGRTFGEIPNRDEFDAGVREALNDAITALESDRPAGRRAEVV